MDKPFLSVVVPVYNAEAYIKNTLSSLLKQTFTDFEVICVNDCSKDTSLDKLSEFEKKDSRIKCIDLKENVGAGEARNIAVKEARGEYIAFLDADDTVETDMFERAVEATQNGKYDKVIWGAVEEHYDDNGKLLKTVPIMPVKANCDTLEEMCKTVLELEEQTLFGYLWNAIFRTSIIKENNLKMRKSIFYEDYFFNLDFLKCSKNLAVIDYIGYHYYKRANQSITRGFSEDYFDLSYERIESLYNYCKENNQLTDRAVEILGGRLLRYTLSALARNNNPLAETDRKSRREWIEKMYEKPLYNELITEKFSTNIVFKFIKFFILKRCTTLLALCGKFVYMVRG